MRKQHKVGEHTFIVIVYDKKHTKDENKRKVLIEQMTNICQ